MTKERLSNGDFLTQLTALFRKQSTSTKGAVYLTQKRLTDPEDGEDSSSPALQDDSHPLTSTLAPLASLFPGIKFPSSPSSTTPKSSSSGHPILFRANNGKSSRNRDGKLKIATIVEPAALEAFLAKYVEVCRAGMAEGLKKRDRKKKDKKKKAKAAKREREKEAKEKK